MATKENLSSASFGGHDSKADSIPKPFKTLKWGKKQAQHLRDKLWSPINHVLISDKSHKTPEPTADSLESLDKSSTGKKLSDRLRLCEKDLSADILFLLSVAKHRKLEVIPGSTGAVLDTVLKLLLVVNEISSKLQLSNNSELVAKYQHIYSCLSALLKWGDGFVYGSPETSIEDLNDQAVLHTNNLTQSVRSLCDFVIEEEESVGDNSFNCQTCAEHPTDDRRQNGHNSDVTNNNNNKVDLSPPLKPRLTTKGTTVPPRPPKKKPADVDKKVIDDIPVISDDQIISPTVDSTTPKPTLDELLDQLNSLSASHKEFACSSSGSESEMLGNLDSSDFSQHLNGDDFPDSKSSSSHREIVTKEGTTRVIKSQMVETPVDWATLQNCHELFDKLNTSEITIKQSVEIKSSQSFQKLIKINQSGQMVESEVETFDDDFPPPVPPRKSKENVNEESFRPRLPSDYENRQNSEEIKVVTPVSHKPPVLPRRLNVNTVKTESHLIHHSSSAHSVSEQIVVNGEVLGSSNMGQRHESFLSASKLQTAQNGKVVSTEGSGSYAENQHNTKDMWRHGDNQSAEVVELTTNDTVIPPPLPPKRRHQIDAYMQLVGNQSESHTDTSNMQQSMLNAYVMIRDNWKVHEESLGHKSFHFNFTSTPNGHGETTSHQPNEFAKDLDPESLADAKRQYQNLQDYIELSDKIHFPQMDNCAEITSNAITSSPKLLEITGVNLLDEMEVAELLVFKPENHEVPEVRGGPIDALVVYASRNASNQKDFLYQESFLTTYRTFLAPLKLLEKLVYRYKRFCRSRDFEKRRASRNAFSMIIRTLDEISANEIDSSVTDFLLDFVYSMVQDGELNLPRLLRKKIWEKIEVKRSQNLTAPPVVLPTVPSTAKPLTILDFKSSQLAEQLTFLDAEYFDKIEVSELLYWSQEQIEEKSPNLANFTEHFNNISYWIRTKILTQEDVKEREKYMMKFIKIMKHLKKLENFNSFLAILSALNSGPIGRLEWSKPIVEALHEHSSLIDSSQSFKIYRQALATARPPCLPYIGLILQDLTGVHIGNPNFLSVEVAKGRRDCVNFAKRWQQFTILDSVRKFKAWSYNLKRDEKILRFLGNFEDHLSDEQIWQISEKIKPLGSGRPTLIN